MPTPHTPTRSVARRVALQAVVMLTVVLLIVSAMVAMNAEKKAFEQVLQSVDTNAKLMAGTLDAFDGAARRMTDRAYQPFRRKFGATFALDPEQQLLQNWGMSLNGDFSQVDAFSQETGGVATVFMRKGEDFERISTSVKKEDGTRALGTMLDHQHPAYARMLAGDAYTGRATLFGTPYMTHYEAVKNDAGQVVGILFIGFDITDFATSIERLVDEERYFENGGTYVIDPGRDNAAAVFVVHPTAKGAKVLDSFPDASAFLDQLRGSASVRIGNAKALFRPQTTDAWVVMRAAQSSGWWVVSEVSDQEALAGYRAVQYRFWASLIAATLVLGLALYVLVRRNVSRPLAELTKAVTSVAQGDLSHSFQSTRRDEIGRLVQEVEGMRQRFLDMLRQLRSAADSINTASVEIASGNQDLSSRTEKAAANLQQTAASVEQLTATVRQSADAASQANQLVSTAAEIATRGGEVVGQVVVTMDEINHSSKKISDIIGVIDGIAFQTNILALNAAVEAARAGEQGRGFAVVASEVRSLAQRSAQAAKEIKGLINNSVDKVQIGSRLVADAGETMNELVGSVQRVSDIMGEISAAASEQSDGIGQLNSAVGQLDRMTQQNAALVEQSAAAAESLKEQAGRLIGVAQVFRLEGDETVAQARLPVPKSNQAQLPEPGKLARSGVVPGGVQRADAGAPTTAARPTPIRAPVPARPPASATPSGAAGAAPVLATAHAGDDLGDWENF